MTDNGIDAIVNGYMEVNSICIPAGHYRMEEGSEHLHLPVLCHGEEVPALIHTWSYCRSRGVHYEPTAAELVGGGYQIMDMVDLSCLCHILTSAITPFIALYYVNNILL